MRSVSCCSTSRADAPGQLVLMTMTLNVNGGSSDWPSLVYASVPNSAHARIRNRTSERWLSAHSDRLKPERGPSGGPPAVMNGSLTFMSGLRLRRFGRHRYVATL